MKSVYEIIAKIASELPSDCIRMAAKSLASGTQCDDAVSLWGGQLAHRKLIADFGAAARTAGLSSGEIAAALLSAATTAENFFAENAVDILWTGPTTTAVPVRRMEQSLCELIDSAREKVLIVSFVAYKAEKVYSAIRSAIERGVRVSFLTEASKEHGGSLEVDPADLLKKKFPEAEFYRWDNVDPSHPAVVHAKCAIADESRALVTSANLTGAAMDKNMELGLMISSRRISSRMAAHFAALVTEHVLKKV